MHNKSNIILIGMPAAGKSTIGVLLAKVLHKDFIDTDVFIQQRLGKGLQELVDKNGIKAFCEIEQEHILQISCRNTVIATGGSVPYSEKAMEHLTEDGIVIYLKLPIDAIKKRLTDFSTRGIVIDKNKTLEELYESRKVLYEKYADITIDTTSLNHEQTVSAVIKSLENKVD